MKFFEINKTAINLRVLVYAVKGTKFIKTS